MWKHVKTHKRIYMFIVSLVLLLVSSVKMWFLPGFAFFMTAFMIIMDWMLPPEITYADPPKRVEHEHNRWGGGEPDVESTNEVDISASLTQGDNNEDV